MAWYALDALDDARDATTALLLPVDRGLWLRLALVALFVGIGGGAPVNSGGGGNVPSTGGGGGGIPTDGAPTPDVPASLPGPESILALVLAILVVLVGIAVLWSAVASVMEFVLVTGLRDREVEIRRPFRENLWRGLRLFGFRVAILVVGVLLVVIPLLLLVAIGIAVPVALLLLIPGLFLVFAIALVGSVVSQLTTDFVVPTMLTEDRGVLDAWRRLWPLIRGEWQQFALYVLVRFGLGIAAGLAVGLVTALAALVVALPFAIVGGVLFFGITAVGGGTIGAAGWAVVALLVLLFVLAVVAVSLVIQVPAVTFLRYYALAVLGFVDADLDLVGVEREVEGAESEDESGEGTESDDVGRDEDGGADASDDGDDGADVGSDGADAGVDEDDGDGDASAGRSS